MKLIVKSYNNNIQNLKTSHNTMKKKTILLIRLYLYFILKLQTFVRPFFKFNPSINIWRSLNIHKKRLIYQVLKSPHVHKKSQEKFLFQNYMKIEKCNLKYFYFNKIYKKLIINLFISICLLSFSSNYFKLTIKYTYKLIY